MKTSGLSDIVHRIPSVHVLCIGDLILDRFEVGRITRISPEAPIPVLRSEDIRTAVGGAGNVATNLLALGAQVSFVSVVGDDSEGRELTGLVSPQCYESHLIVDADRPTSLKTRFVAEGQQMLRVDREATHALHARVEHKLLETISALVPQADAVILSDYAKGVLTTEVLRRTLAMCREHGVKTFVDPKSGNYDRYLGADVLTPNAKELEEASGQRIDDNASVEEAGKHVIHKYGVPTIVATRGPDGMSILTESVCNHLPARAREVYDVSGAGDTVIAAFAAAVATGAALQEAAELANITAGIVVEKMGTAVVHSDELLAALGAQTFAFHGKLLALESASEKVSEWHQHGLTVGFTNGCFDLIHPGHLSLLNQAAQACDRLIVALNNDESVRRLKGPNRPVQNEHVRESVVASLEVVDGVLLFAGDTPLREIQALRPDVLIKGADYVESEVVGAEFTRDNGGKVVLANIVDGFSTTRTIARIQRPPLKSKVAAS